jgi:hypothetical protein
VRNGVIRRDLLEVKSKMDGGELIRVTVRKGQVMNQEKALMIPAHKPTCLRSNQTGSSKINKTERRLRKYDDILIVTS